MNNLTTKEQELINTLNLMIQSCKPILYKDFNVSLVAKDIEILRNLEKENPKLGLAHYGTPQEGITTLSLIATITDILIDKRLGFLVEEDGTISSVQLL
jgi:hypothetical protein